MTLWFIHFSPSSANKCIRWRSFFAGFRFAQVHRLAHPAVAPHPQAFAHPAQRRRRPPAQPPGQRVQKTVAVGTIGKNLPPLIAPGHDVVKGSRIFDAQWSGHGGHAASAAQSRKGQSVIIIGLTLHVDDQMQSFCRVDETNSPRRRLQAAKKDENSSCHFTDGIYIWDSC